ERRGAITISADFRQRVSPSHGIDGSEAIKLGASVQNTDVTNLFRFSKNMRQSVEITRFLRAFHEKIFGEMAPFDVPENAVRTTKPSLLICRHEETAQYLKPIKNILERLQFRPPVAVLNINDDERELARIRAMLT